MNLLRRWSPWHLRRSLAAIRDSLHDECPAYTLDRANTTIIQAERYAVFALRGHLDPWVDAEQYSVRGSTLVIKSGEAP